MTLHLIEIHCNATACQQKLFWHHCS